MKYGAVPGVDKTISRLVMGVDNQDTKYQIVAMFDDFLERGGNCFDSAYSYGRLREKLLGRYVRDRGIRENVTVIVKGAHTPFCTPDHVVSQLEMSLDNLNFEYADIYMLHRDNAQVPVGEFADCLNQLARRARIRAFGGSNWTPARIDELNAYAESREFVGFRVVSNHFSLAKLVREPWPGVIGSSDRASREWLARRAVQLFAFSCLGRGFLSDTGKPEARSATDVIRSWYSEDNFRRKDQVKRLAEKRGTSPVVVSLAYVLSQPFEPFVVIGPRTVGHTAQSCQALELELEPDEIAWLDGEGPSPSGI